MANNEYDLTDGALVISAFPVTGFVEGDAIELKRNKKENELSVGADGETCYSTTNDLSGTVTIKLMQSSQASKTITAMALTNTKFPILYKAPNGFTYGAVDCKFDSSFSDAKFAQKVGEYDFTILCPALEVVPPVTLPTLITPTFKI